MSDFDLAGFLPYQLAVLAERASREFSALYRERFGISVAEWRVVAHLGQAGTVSVREIHARAGMDKSKVSRAASRLEAMGYVAKARDDGDGRLVALTLTDAGRRMLADIVPLARGYQAELLERLGEDAAAFRRGVARLLAAPDAGVAPAAVAPVDSREAGL